MISDPREMSEVTKLINRVKRLYGMQRLTLDEHNEALNLIEQFCVVLEGTTTTFTEEVLLDERILE